jgi:UDP-3-O-[3-hydroxymyristoyl] glucosamine N-acyltransferase
MATVAELARLVSGKVIGDGERQVRGFGTIEDAGPDQITFLVDRRYLGQVGASRAGAILSATPLEGFAGAQILVADPNLAFARIVECLHVPAMPARSGIDSRAAVDPGASVDPAACVHPFAVVEAGARVGAGSVIGAGAYVGPRSRIGAGSVLHPRVVVLHDVEIGDRVVIHSGAVIGADGFGYATGPDGVHRKIPQVGRVVIEDDVEIGANTCIDRARLAETRIGRGTKIDNLVQIGHNVHVGAHGLIVAQAGVAGSTHLGRHVVLGGHVGVAGHLEIGDGAQVGAFSGVGNDLEGGRGYMGIPARPIAEGKKIRVLSMRLPEIYERLRAAEEALRRIGALERKERDR